jgi:hypothetical protein
MMPTEAQLVSAARSDLAALGFEAEWIVAQVDNEGRWRVTLRVNGREFVFGLLGAGGFQLGERRGGRTEDLVAETLAPATNRPELLWAYAFTLLRHALHDARFRGFAGPVR